MYLIIYTPLPAITNHGLTILKITICCNREQDIVFVVENQNIVKMRNNIVSILVSDFLFCLAMNPDGYTDIK